MGKSDIPKLERWRKERPQEAKTATLTWKQKHKDRVNLSNKQSRDKQKYETLVHYSGTSPPQCANPYGEHEKPYTTLEALQIDHIYGGGTVERKEKGIGAHIIWWLRKHNYPKGYQVLCANCQWIKRHRNKEFFKKALKRGQRNP